MHIRTDQFGLNWSAIFKRYIIDHERFVWPILFFLYVIIKSNGILLIDMALELPNSLGKNMMEVLASTVIIKVTYIYIFHLI